MKLQGEYDFQDFMDLYFNKYYFNSKQNLANRVLLTLTISALLIEGALYIFFNEYFELFNSYFDAKFLAFLAILLLVFYFFKPKFIYENYKKAHKPDGYIEVDEKELKFCVNKEVKVDMKKLRNTVALKNGYFLDFDETFLLYIPHRFFRNTEDLRFFHSLCYRTKEA